MRQIQPGGIPNYLRLFWLSGLSLLATVGCQPNRPSKQAGVTEREDLQVYSSNLKELTDEEYPDNPDIEIRHAESEHIKYDHIELEELENGKFRLRLIPESDSLASIEIPSIQLLELIPTINDQVKGNEYLTQLCLINQEWNRNQIRLSPSYFTASEGLGSDADRVDLARNCLNSYLWEVFIYRPENGKSKVWYHGWFNFSAELYAELFEQRNKEPFSAHSAYLEDWQDPANKIVELEALREVKEERLVEFQAHNASMYPLEGERKKKRKEIIWPERFTSMSELLDDSSSFATFSPPGFYNRKDPRPTELGRFRELKEVSYRSTQRIDERSELHMIFTDGADRVTQLVIGGLDLKSLPKLVAEDANQGQMYSMGIGNHAFYESYEEHLANSSKTSPYFGLLLNADDEFLDSHALGIDGPLLHWDNEVPGLLHVWLLSFERHALVSHYTLNLTWLNSENL